MLCTIKLPSNLNLLNSQFPRSKYSVDIEHEQQVRGTIEVQEVDEEQYSELDEGEGEESKLEEGK